MIVRVGAGALALLHGANGAFMVIAPHEWWVRVPGVTDTGPFNSHFVADVGLAFLASAIGFAIFAARGEARLAGIVAAAFPALHVGLHVAEMLHGRSAHAGLELATIIAPALAGVLICWPWPGRAP